MKYYITTPELAHGISAIKAQQMGCTGVTAFWWGVTHTEDNSYLAIPHEDYADIVTPATFDEEGNELTPETTTIRVVYSHGDIEILSTDLVDIEQPENLEL
jgi:hypothetical protein